MAAPFSFPDHKAAIASAVRRQTAYEAAFRKQPVVGAPIASLASAVRLPSPAEQGHHPHISSEELPPAQFRDEPTPASVLREMLDCAELNVDEMEDHTPAAI